MNKLVIEAAAILGLALLGAVGIMAVGTQNAEQRQTRPTPKPLDAAGMVERFRTRGLPIGDAIVYTAENDPNSLLGRPNQYTSKANWLDGRLTREITDDLSASDGGTVEVFASEDDARRRQEYVGAIAKTGGPFAEYAYRDGRVLIRLSRRLTPDQVAQYDAALRAP